MKNKKELVRYFNELYLIEKEARDMYNGFLPELKDKDTYRQVEEIRNDKEKHIKIVNEIIKIIERN